MEAKILLLFSRTIFIKTTIRFSFFSRTGFLFLFFIMATIKRFFGEKNIKVELPLETFPFRLLLIRSQSLEGNLEKPRTQLSKDL